MADLFGVAGRKLLAELDFPEPWRSHVQASLELIDDLERRIGEIERWLRRSGADHRYIPLLMTAPGIGWITGQKADRGDLVHADPQPTVQALRSGRRHFRPDCMTVHF